MTRRYTKPAKKLTKLTVPQQAVPHVKFLYAEMHRQRLTYEDVEWKSGILKNTLKAWRHKNQPNLANIEACLGATGWSLVPIPTESALPADIVDELRPIADRLGLAMPKALELLAEILARGPKFQGTQEESTNDGACPHLVRDRTGSSAQRTEATANSGDLADVISGSSSDFALAA